MQSAFIKVWDLAVRVFHWTLVIFLFLPIALVKMKASYTNWQVMGYLGSSSFVLSGDLLVPDMPVSGILSAPLNRY